MNLISAVAARSLTCREIIQHEGLSTTKILAMSSAVWKLEQSRARLKAHGEYENKQTVKNRFGY